VPVCF